MTARVRAVFDRRRQVVTKMTKGFVFEREDGTTIPYCSIDTQHDRNLTKKALRVRIYDFRHTFGTRLGESGADSYTIMKRMGHSSILISQRYVQPTPERIENAFAQLDAYNERVNAAVAEKAEEATPHDPKRSSKGKSRVVAACPPTKVPYK